jgi:DNA repair protein RecN (Recombination protein N)
MCRANDADIMLTQIHIRDFAIIESVTLDFTAGLTVLTGETGAGKSILIDAIGLALGDRADSGSVRHGAERAEISVSFDPIVRPAIVEWLSAQDLEAGGDCIIRRVIGADGRSRAYINGRPVPLQSLKELGEQLIDIHGQHAHQSLLRRDLQRELLDAYAQHATPLEQLAAHYRRWKRQRDELTALRSAAADRAARLDLLRYQVGELTALGLTADDVEALDREHARLANADRLLSASQQAVQALYEGDEDTLDVRIGRLLNELQPLAALDDRLTPACDLLNSALIQIREAADTLREYAGGLETDPGRLEEVETRLGALHDLARKHRVLPGELPALCDALQTQLAALEGADARTDELEAAIAADLESYRAIAAELSAGRRRAAAELGRRVSAMMVELGMPGGVFDIVVAANEDDTPGPFGMDAIDFLVSANPGQPPKPLAKVASGGELSRISLAIQVVAANQGGIPTLIFDEVDAGIGGGVAETVGRRLRALADARQVLCVTHLPQVAAQAHQHLQVVKRVTRDQTHTAIHPLSHSDRLDEIARMLGGVEITAQTRAHAAEMLDRAGEETKPARKRRAQSTVD